MDETQRILQEIEREVEAGAGSDDALLWSVIMDAHESGLHELARRLTEVWQQRIAAETE